MTRGSIIYRIRDDIVILDPNSRECLSDDDGLQPVVRTLSEHGHTKFLLDLRQIPYIDSTCLGGLARTSLTITQRGGQLKLVNVAKRVRDLLRITRLAPAFEVFDSEEEAIRSFDPPLLPGSPVQS